MYTHVYTDMYIHVHVYIHVHTCRNTYTDMYHTCIHVHVYICTHVHTCTYIYRLSSWFTGEGAILNFAAGENRKSISIDIIGDNFPEPDESFRVALSNPTGGSILSEYNVVNITIEANDNAAGIVGFATNSRSAIIMEGETINLILNRTISQLGEIQVYWNITGSGNVSTEFEQVSGSVNISDVRHSTSLFILSLSVPLFCYLTCIL